MGLFSGRDGRQEIAYRGIAGNTLHAGQFQWLIRSTISTFIIRLVDRKRATPKALKVEGPRTQVELRAVAVQRTRLVDERGFDTPP